MQLEVKVVIGLFAFVALVVFLFYPRNHGSSYEVSAVLFHKSYTPEQTSTGVGVSTNGDPVVTTSSSDEAYTTIWRAKDGSVYTINDRAAFFQYQEGQQVKLVVQPRRNLFFADSPEVYVK